MTEPSKKPRDWYRQVAREAAQSVDDEVCHIQVLPGARVDRREDGAYVNAWIWIDDPDFLEKLNQTQRENRDPERN